MKISEDDLFRAYCAGFREASRLDSPRHESPDLIKQESETCAHAYLSKFRAHAVEGGSDGIQR